MSGSGGMALTRSVIFVWREGPAGGDAAAGAGIAGDADASDFESVPRFASVFGAVLRFLCTGGAFGSLGFLCLFCFGASWPASAFGFTVVPGFRPGFFRGTPAAVNWTGFPSGPVPTLADFAPTTISSISSFDLSCVNLGGDPGGEMTEGGDESSGEDRLLDIAIRRRISDSSPFPRLLWFSDLER